MNVRFTYTYRSSDGQRHSAEIEAESRDAAFARIRRELGIKPINVTAGDGMEAQRDRKEGSASGDGRRKTVAYVLAVVFVRLAITAWLLLRNGGWGEPPARFTVNTPQGPVTYPVATPLPRQAIPGDRVRIEAATGGAAFPSAAERTLARYAEPGRKAEHVVAPPEAEFQAALRVPVRIASTDFTETVDLKRIVAGMKREMRAYLAGGGTAEGYIAELEKRQRLEISYRERAERKLEEMLSDPKAAYAYWLKANASLKSMGIYELPLPDALRSYQMGLDIEE